MNTIKFWALSLLAVSVLSGPELEALSVCDWNLGVHRAWIAPQTYQVKRCRRGATYPGAWLGGIRGCLERVEPNSLYWGVEGSWATGTLKGQAGENQLKFHMTDTEVEGRVGATLEIGDCLSFSFTPFVGGGYYKGTNDYVSPSPMTVRVIDRYTFTTIGFLSRVCWMDIINVGLNVKARQTMDGKEKITHDPDNDNLEIQFEDKTQWIFELPICTSFCWNEYPIEVGLVPFYERRHYGEREAFPVDFRDTKYFIYGFRLLLGTYF